MQPAILRQTGSPLVGAVQTLAASERTVSLS
jgi:hypothetical protein